MSISGGRFSRVLATMMEQSKELPKTSAGRKHYKTPVLIVHGDIEAITGTKVKFKKNDLKGFGPLDSNPFSS